MDRASTGVDEVSTAQGGDLPARTAAAVVAGNLAAKLSKVAGGGGGIIGGRVTLALDPNALGRLCRDRTVALVTGTNGKTTTTMMLARAMSVLQPVATNHSGANMPDGLVAALSTDQAAPLAVLEIDENYLPKISDAVQPAVIVLLNLSRDQMDRVGEVRHTERNLRTAIARLRDTTVVANCDDVLVTSAATEADSVIWVSAGGNWRGDSTSCPRCGMRVHVCVTDGTVTDWYCDCGFRRPTPTWAVREGLMTTPSGECFELALRLPGSANEADATLALAAATHLSVPLKPALDRIRTITGVGGRYTTVSRNGRIVRILLAKNPAGWAETLPLLREDTSRPIIIAVNGREADGRDLSWLWDIPFEQLAGRQVLATGERSADLAVRLTYAGVQHTHVPDPYQAIDGVDPGSVELVANYTAFRDLKSGLSNGA
ncbi:UDP-N-acetylmuramyl tripeptide synthase [Kutzneria viridogrisea]|nr:MurT ligase domain-containing protein [Kutzneria albida]MBA8927883.1 UDP-N-acetylmuramyl tripeptide synthase [Kutzneria viridogrisea]